MVASELFALYCKSFMFVLSLNECDWNIFLFKKKKKKKSSLPSKPSILLDFRSTLSHLLLIRLPNFDRVTYYKH
jgi:hypothetical protein